MSQSSDRYRAFCAYGPHYAEPGCGWEAVVDSETEAERLAKNHSKFQTHEADYERYVDTASGQEAGDS